MSDDHITELIAEAKRTQDYSRGYLRSLVRSLADALEAALLPTPEASDDEREVKLVADFRQHVLDAIQSGMFEDAGWSSEHYSKHFHVYVRRLTAQPVLC